MKNETHNGWTNYATWRVNLEIFDGMDDDSFHNMGAGEVKEYAEEMIFQDVHWNSLAGGYIRAFLADVNWHEIRNAYNGGDS